MPVALPPEEDKPGVPLPPPLLFALPLLVGAALEFVFATRLFGGPWRWAAGGALLLAGLALNVVAAATQKRAGTDFLPDRPSTTIVGHGPYAWTRNPMYLGFALMTAGLAFVADSAWMLLAVPLGIVLIDRIVIAREERYLERKFGDGYLAYKGRVRRWL